jgi:beta-glucosidase
MKNKGFHVYLVVALALALLLTGSVAAVQIDKDKRALPPYLNVDLSIDERVEDLLRRMTLAEKIGQMNMPCMYLNKMGKELEDKIKAARQFTSGSYVSGVGPGGGFFTLANNMLFKGPRQQAEFFNHLQKIALEKTRLKIPLLQTEEGTHGLMCSGATIFPEGLALGSTWNMDLIDKVYTVVAKEARAVGIHQLFTLVIEPNRDPRLGRNEECYSEDSFLCSRIASAIVHAVQGNNISRPDKTVAGFCHYPGQSEPVSGLERGEMQISERKLREVFLPPWVAAIRDGNALGVMATYPAINGVPVHASKRILTDILRYELGFQGLVLGEGNGLTTLVYEGLAETQKQAGVLALKAGVDVGISFEEAYLDPLIENVKEGNVDMEWIDRSVRRILRIKFQLGLFEQPYVDPVHAVKVSHTPEHQELALEAAREGVVVLKNEGDLLPLEKNIKSIAVIGPNADHETNQLGDYTSNVILEDIVTVLDGIRMVSPQSRIEYVKGCNIVGSELDEIEKAQRVAKTSDVAVVVLGENEWHAPDKTGTGGEGYDVATLELTGLQQELVKAIHRTGTPTVVVLISGRPLAIRWIAGHVPAIVQPWRCGEKGGLAVAEILFGDYNPSGRLPITFPRHAGQLPVYYDSKPSKTYWLTEGWGNSYADLNPEPLYVFGHGLSYTRFEYSNLVIDPSEAGRRSVFTVSVDITNIGKRPGQEVVQLYRRDLLSSVTTPVKKLAGFSKITVQPGETETVVMTITPEQLAILNENFEPVVEPGTFRVMVGSSSKDIHLTGSFVCN